MKNFGDIFTKIWKLQTPIPGGKIPKPEKTWSQKPDLDPNPDFCSPTTSLSIWLLTQWDWIFHFPYPKFWRIPSTTKESAPSPTSLLLKNHPLWRIFYYFQTCLTKRSSATPSLVPSNNGPAYNSLSFLLTLDYHRSFFGNHCNWSRILISRIQLVDFHKF